MLQSGVRVALQQQASAKHYDDKDKSGQRLSLPCMMVD